MALREAFVEPVLTEQLPGTVSEAGSTEVSRLDCELSLCMLILQWELGSKQCSVLRRKKTGRGVGVHLFQETVFRVVGIAWRNLEVQAEMQHGCDDWIRA